MGIFITTKDTNEITEILKSSKINKTICFYPKLNAFPRSAVENQLKLNFASSSN